MSQDTEDLAARLAALEGTTGKKRVGARPSPLTAILGVAGIVAVGGLAWTALQPSPEAPLLTSQRRSQRCKLHRLRRSARLSGS